MNFAVLADAKLLFILVVSALLSMLTSVVAASRPAAVITGKVAQATTISSLLFMVSRLANLLYLPLMATFAGAAEVAGHTKILEAQVHWVILASAAGSLVSWWLLPNFVALYCHLVEVLDSQGIRSFIKFSVMKASLQKFLKGAQLQARLGHLHGISPGFLSFNIAATAIWTVGALCALVVSAQLTQYRSTAILLSGLVNSFAAITFTLWVDPQAALITDEAKNRPESRPKVDACAIHLTAGNFIGGLLGLLVLPWGISLINWATHKLGQQGTQLAGGILAMVLLNALVTLLASSTYAARVAAVVTGRVATALAIYNLFFLVTRLAGQIYFPLLGSLSDHLRQANQLDQLEGHLRGVLAGASLGSLVGLLLLPTFVEVIRQAIFQLEKRGSMTLVLLRCLHPGSWRHIGGCLRRPSFLGIGMADMRRLPRPFLVGNIIVLAVHSVGGMAAIYAGAHLDAESARTANLLSSVVNGVATITLSLVVDPTVSRLTDSCANQRRPLADIQAAAVGLLLGMLVGTLFSQLIFSPATWVISLGARLLAR
jgi:hypothetical protein